MKAMILAAGFGTRMRPLTDHTPKPLLKAAGKPLIQYHIERLVDAGIKDIVINTSWLGEQLAEFIGDGSAFGASIQISHEETPLETAGGIIKARPLLDSNEDFFVLVNGDIWSDFDFHTLIASAHKLKNHTLAHLVMVENPPQHPKGDFYLCGNGNISQTVPEDKCATTLEKLTFSGISLINRQLLNSVELNREGKIAAIPLAPILRQAMNEGRVTGVKAECVWMDIGTPERLSQLEEHLGFSTDN